MAGEDRSSSPTLGREQRLAAEIVRRFGLSPPFDLDHIVERFADVADASIPGACDGLVLDLHGPRPRPLVLLQRGQVEVRRRFTLAHELGHILLPWHVGDAFLCDTGRFRAFASAYEVAVVDAEPEANRFAAELLVPTRWLESCIASLGAEEIAPLMRAIEDARVSAYVACLRLQSMLPAGHAFAISQGGKFRMRGQTQGTGVLPHSSEDDLDPERLDRWAHRVEVMRYGPTRVTWWTFHGTEFVGDRAVDSRTWREVLNGLLDRYAPSEPERGRIQRSLNGVLAAAHGDARYEGDATAAALYVRFRGRFAKARALPAALLNDPEFDLLLHKRAEDFAAK